MPLTIEQLTQALSLMKSKGASEKEMSLVANKAKPFLKSINKPKPVFNTKLQPSAAILSGKLSAQPSQPTFDPKAPNTLYDVGDGYHYKKQNGKYYYKKATENEKAWKQHESGSIAELSIMSLYGDSDFDNEAYLSKLQKEKDNTLKNKVDFYKVQTNTENALPANINQDPNSRILTKGANNYYKKDGLWYERPITADPNFIGKKVENTKIINNLDNSSEAPSLTITPGTGYKVELGKYNIPYSDIQGKNERQVVNYINERYRGAIKATQTDKGRDVVRIEHSFNGVNKSILIPLPTVATGKEIYGDATWQTVTNDINNFLNGDFENINPSSNVYEGKQADALIASTIKNEDIHAPLFGVIEGGQEDLAATSQFFDRNADEMAEVINLLYPSIKAVAFGDKVKIYDPNNPEDYKLIESKIFSYQPEKRNKLVRENRSIITNFVNKHTSDEDITNILNARKGLKEEYTNIIDNLKLTDEEELEITDGFGGGLSMFDVEIKSKKRQVRADADGKLYYQGEVVGELGYKPSVPNLTYLYDVEYEHQPYEEDIERYSTELAAINKEIGKEPPTREEILQYTKEQLIEEAILEKYEANLSKYMDETENPLVIAGSLVNLSESNRSYNNYLKESNSIIAYMENNPAVKRQADFLSKLKSPDYEFKIEEGDQTVVVEGKTIPFKLYERYRFDKQSIDNYLSKYEDIEEKMQELAFASKDNAIIWDNFRRNYNDAEKFFSNIGAGFADIGLNIMRPFDDRIDSFQTIQHARRDRFQRDVAFKDLKFSNFGKFFWQEAGNQIPIFTTLMIPGIGLYGMAASSFGGRWGDMRMANEAARQEDKAQEYSKTSMILQSTGFAVTEFIFDKFLTMPVLNRFKKGMFKTKNGRVLFKESSKDYVKNNFLKQLVYEPVQETAAETLTTLSQNYMSGEPLFDNVGHAAFSGGMFGFIFGGSPYIKGAVMTNFTDLSKTKQVRQNLTRIGQLDLLVREGNLDDETVKIQKETIKELELENENILRETETTINELSPVILERHMALTLQQEKLRIQAENIRNNKKLSKSEQQAALDVLDAKFAQLEAGRAYFNDKGAFMSEWESLQHHSGKSQEDKDNIQRIKNDARKELLAQGNTNPTSIELNKKAAEIYNKEQVKKHNKSSKNTKLGKNFKEVETANDALSLITDLYDADIRRAEEAGDAKLVKEIQKEKENQLKDFSENLGNIHGYNYRSKIDNKRTAVAIVENQAKDERFQTRTHELGHEVFAEVLGENPAAFESLSNQILNHLEKTNPNLHKKLIEQVEKDQDGNIVPEELVMNFLEEVGGGKVDFKSEKNKGFAGLLGFITNRTIKDATNTNFDLDLKGETDIINFLVGIGKKIKNGTLTKQDIKDIKDNKVLQDIKNEVNESLKVKDLKSISFSKTIAEGTLNDYARDENGNFNAEKYDPNSRIIATQLPGMVEAQVNNYLKERPSLKIEGENKQDLVYDVISRLLDTAKKTGKSDLNNYDGRGTLYGYINGRIKYRMLDAFKDNQTYVEQFGRKELNDAMQKLILEADDTSVIESQITETVKSKVNVLKIGKVAGKETDIIETTKVKKGDTFKEVTDKNINPIAEIIFDVPSSKITDPKKNLTYAKKIVDGIPESSEAGNIQDFYRIGKTLENTIKILPDFNVTQKDADINELGENIQVSPEVKGRAIGLKNRVLEYFYDRVILPDGKQKRSDGKKSQVKLWKLKEKFINPTAEVLEQVKTDLGITPLGELNNYNRDIGQLLKGLASFTSQQTSLSAAQRKLDQKLKETKEKKQEIKQQIADITTAQGSLAFSRRAVNDIVNMRDTLDLDTKGVDNLLKSLELDPTINIKTKEGRKKFLEVIEEKLLPLMPKEFWIKDGIDIFTKSHNNYGDFSMATTDGKRKSNKNEYLQPKEAEAYDTFRNDVRTLIKNHKNFGAPIKDANFNVDKNYGTVFGNAKTYKTKFKDKQRINKWNKDIALIHKEMWKRFNKAIRADKTGQMAGFIGTYLKLTANDKQSWHRLGAQVVGYSKNMTIGKIEFEHAMPATAAYLYLLDSALNKNISFDTSYELMMDNYKLIVLDKAMDNKLTKARTEAGYSLRFRMPDKWSPITNSWWERYFNSLVVNQDGGIDPNSIVDLDGVPFDKKFNINQAGETISKAINKSPKKINDNKTVKSAVDYSRNPNNPTKGITVLDFDDTLATTKSKVKATAPDGTVTNLNAEQYASDYQDLLAQGYTFDFSDFSKVVKGKIAPLFQKALKLQGKFGPENMFVLTARPVDSAPAIFEFLKANGLNIPLKNITGLANSTSEAKALWVANKVTEGYNDFYFADDALANVQAVKNMLDQFDVKSKVQQARVKFSRNSNKVFNEIIEQTFGVEAFKKFSPAKGRLRGKTQGRFDIFIPPSAEDFKGLIYGLLAKGKTGEQQLEFFNETLLKPFSRASQEVDLARVQIMTDYKKLRKDMPNVRKKMNNKIGDTNYTVDNAIRVYLWNKAGFNIPGLTKTDRAKLIKAVEADLDIKAYANSLSAISKLDQVWKEPGDYWLTENIASDMTEIINSVHRQEALAEFKENREKIFGKWQNGKLVGPNMAKLEAVKGSAYVEALNDMLWRMENGTNRNFGSDRTTNAFTNWVNGSIGAIMFFNQRSALLQLISSVNYVNYDDNNLIAAGKAFANQKQYWTDFAYLWNSPTLVARRAGLRGNIETSEIALAAEKGGPKAVFAYMLKLGFTPTQIADSFAICSGGAAMYRNKVNKYLKDGLTQEEAETKAFEDFNEITQENQQSSRADKISMQQAGPLGRFILAFQNTPMQYARLNKRDIQDLINRRSMPGKTLAQSDKIRLARITYYVAIQNFIFGALQSALFRFMFEEDDEEKQKKEVRIANGMMDTVLRGMGVQGAVVSTLKNMVIKFIQQNNKKTFDESAVVLEFLNLSPPIGSKARKIVSGMKTLEYQKDEIKHMPKLNINNPVWQVVGNFTSGTTNIPLDRVVNKLSNIKEAMDSDNAAWQRIALLNGWNAWDLGVTPDDLEKAREEVDVIKEAKKEAKKEATKIRKEEERLEKQRQGKFDYLTDEEVAVKEKKVELTKLNKAEQVNMLMDLGLSSKDIKALKYEDDRVNKIIELTKK